MPGRPVAILGILLLLAPGVRALDPPHDASWGVDCSSCHTTHNSPGGSLTTVGGNGNLCLSCHMVGSLAGAYPFVDADQALPMPGLPSGTSPSGNSHRWDSGAAGHAKVDAGNTSAGEVVPGGLFTGRYAKTYTITVTSSGDSGAAVFSWSDTQNGGATGVTSGVDVPLDEGVTVTFVDADTPPSFVAGDGWKLFVRTDLRHPETPAMSARLEDGRAMCSTCHDEHKQAREPFDPSAPAYGGAGTGEGRHFMRVDNDEGTMCYDCHNDRVVTTVIDGSHPVDIFVPGTGGYQMPSTLPLDPNDRVVCLTCHQVHDAPTNDGSVLRSADRTALCAECHTLADTATPAAHLDPASSGMLWPGGPDPTSSFPAIEDVSQTGSCGNCHQSHGWPTSADPMVDYPRLQVDFEEDLCYTCHDGSPAEADVATDFAKNSAHPLDLASGEHQPGESALVNNRHVECEDCHGPHDAVARVDLPGAATEPRPASGPLTGALGINLAGNAVSPASYEYELCFRCHADSAPAGAPTPREFPENNARLEFNGSKASYHPVAVEGTNSSVPSLVSGWDETSLMSCTTCHNNDDGPVTSGTGANGPHGSDWPSLLERRYETADPQAFSEAKYAMCFKCHSWSSIQSGASFDDHNKHINGEDTPCNVCHDPHASDKPKLINFDTSVVTPFQGTLEYVSTGTHNGRCTLVCHGKNHPNFTY